MSNLNASHKVMQHYLSALLTEEPVIKQTVSEKTPEADVLAKQQQQQLNALLAQASQKELLQVSLQNKLIEKTVAPVITNKQTANLLATQPEVINATVVIEKVTEKVTEKAAEKTLKKAPEKEYRKGRFQALFFQLAGLKIAVPLKELGGIHKLGHVNSLIGKPEWFKGVMLYREQKINIVDTARWVMPEKYDQQMQQQLDYQYVIMLANSNWGICCESLVNTFMLEQEDVQWRQVEGKRPWMAGVIKEHMCVLVDVDAMIDLLNRGLDITA
ncbi:chemotaxis protein CheW [Rheinheimera salexigens]|uniref:Chemotaxis protein CheW n=1 Tax=Rheinheimera salexigens TaxID=1628148 RepID=A0A1E7Q819_9GAMM|nr:chemotaxis protein CheW [Rheinheimera salexigens]OEY70260.1 chemotaxis protein CheW [Rheinheimera salexigens]